MIPLRRPRFFYPQVFIGRPLYLHRIEVIDWPELPFPCSIVEDTLLPLFLNGTRFFFFLTTSLPHFLPADRWQFPYKHTNGSVFFPLASSLVNPY